DEQQLRAAGERGLELLPVARNRELRVVRREHEPDDRARTAANSTVCRLRDARRPVLHPGEDRPLERALERGARPLCDRVQRRLPLDAEAAVALHEIVEMLRGDRAAAAN